MNMDMAQTLIDFLPFARCDHAMSVGDGQNHDKPNSLQKNKNL